MIAMHLVKLEQHLGQAGDIQLILMTAPITLQAAQPQTGEQS